MSLLLSPLSLCSSTRCIIFALDPPLSECRRDPTIDASLVILFNVIILLAVLTKMRRIGYDGEQSFFPPSSFFSFSGGVRMTHSWWLGDDNNDSGAMGEGTRRQMQDELRGEEENAPPPPPPCPSSHIPLLLVLSSLRQLGLETLPTTTSTVTSRGVLADCMPFGGQTGGQRVTMLLTITFCFG